MWVKAELKEIHKTKYVGKIEGNLSNWGKGFSLISCNISLYSIVLATEKNKAPLQREKHQNKDIWLHTLYFNFFQGIYP